MAITAQQHDRLTVLLENLGSVRSRLYPSSQRFVDDQIARLEQWGTDIKVSVKQWKWLEDLHREFCAGEPLPSGNGPTHGDDPPPHDDIPDDADTGMSDDDMPPF